MVADLQNHIFITYVDELISVPQVRWLTDLVPVRRRLSFAPA